MPYSPSQPMAAGLEGSLEDPPWPPRQGEPPHQRRCENGGLPRGSGHHPLTRFSNTVKILTKTSARKIKPVSHLITRAAVPPSRRHCHLSSLTLQPENKTPLVIVTHRSRPRLLNHSALSEIQGLGNKYPRVAKGPAFEMVHLSAGGIAFVHVLLCPS